MSKIIDFDKCEFICKWRSECEHASACEGDLPCLDYGDCFSCDNTDCFYYGDED